NYISMVFGNYRSLELWYGRRYRRKPPSSSTYLSFARINGDMGRGQEHLQGLDQDGCQRCRSIQHNLDEVAQGIEDQKATDMEHIAHHTQDPIVPQPAGRSRLRQPPASPDDDIVGQAAQQHHHLLRFKAFFAALGTAQALLVAFEGGLHAPAALII